MCFYFFFEILYYYLILFIYKSLTVSHFQECSHQLLLAPSGGKGQLGQEKRRLVAMLPSKTDNVEYVAPCSKIIVFVLI